MRRRTLLLAAMAMAARQALAQPAGTVRRIAILELGGHRLLDDQWSLLAARLKELGYEEGRNLKVERRNAEGVESRLPQLTKELLATTPEVVLVTSTPAAQALKRATQTVPIVITGTADPVATGLVASLARPGGNITGVSLQLNDIAVKRLEMLREIRPQTRRIGMLGPAANAGVQAVLRLTQEKGKAMGMEVRIFDAADPPAIERAFASMMADKTDAILMTQILFSHHRQVVALAAQYRIPVAYVDREILEAGGLLVLGPSRERLYRQAADYAHRILQGARPGDLAIIQPTEFWLGINLRTARGLGLKVPQSLLVRADRVIE